MWVIANIIYQIHNTIHGIDALLQNQFQKINFFFFLPSLNFVRQEFLFLHTKHISQGSNENIKQYCMREFR